MSRSGKDEEQATANDSHHERKTLPDLLQLLLAPREQAVGHPVIGNSNGHEDHDGHDGVDEVGEAHLELVVARHRHGGERRLEDGEAARGDEAVVEGSVGAVETVCEVEEEAGEGADGEEEVDHEGLRVAALSVLVDGR